MNPWYTNYYIDNIQSVLMEIDKFSLCLDYSDLSVTRQLDYYYQTIDRYQESITGPARYSFRLYKPVQVGQATGYGIHSIDMLLGPRYA
jgi:hypothetical protein